jgi:hypothetical protein
MKKSKTGTGLSPNQQRVLTKLKQAKKEGMSLFLTGRDRITAQSLVRKGLVINRTLFGIKSSVNFEVV